MAEKLSEDQLSEIREAFAMFDHDNTGRTEIREAFAMFDHNNTGRMERGQLGTALQSLGQNPSDADIADMVKQADKQGTGFITEKDFVAVVTKNWKEVNSEDDIVAAFKVFDRDGTGYINAKELTTVLLNLGEHLTQEEVADVMEAANLDADGQLNYQQLTQILLAPAK